jgi:hypothetical protein
MELLIKSLSTGPRFGATTYEHSAVSGRSQCHAVYV